MFVREEKEVEQEIEQEEMCVVCSKPTGVSFDTHIDLRYNYIEGCGQLCLECGVEYN